MVRFQGAGKSAVFLGCVEESPLIFDDQLIIRFSFRRGIHIGHTEQDQDIPRRRQDEGLLSEVQQIAESGVAKRLYGTTEESEHEHHLLLEFRQPHCILRGAIGLSVVL